MRFQCHGIRRWTCDNKFTREDIRKRSILTLFNSDNCFFRFFLYAQIYHEHRTLWVEELHHRWKAVRHENSVLQRNFAQDLTRRAGFTGELWDSGNQMFPCSPISNVTIIVYNFNNYINNNCILLYNISYCEEREHRYSNKCCNNILSYKQQDVNTVRCEICKCLLFENTCFEHHRAIKSYDGKMSRSICSVIKFCEDCGHIINSMKEDEYGVSFCKICSLLQSINHLCYM